MTEFNNYTFHIQNFYSDGEMAREINHQMNNIPTELDTPKAKELWKIAQDKGWVDDTLYPLIPMSKASILAATISEKLVLVYKWKPFEILWNTQNLKAYHNNAMAALSSKEILEEITTAYKDF